MHESTGCPENPSLGGPLGAPALALKEGSRRKGRGWNLGASRIPWSGNAWEWTKKKQKKRRTGAREGEGEGARKSESRACYPLLFLSGLSMHGCVCMHACMPAVRYGEEFDGEIWV